MKKKISIIIPVYNKEHYLRKILSQISMQNFPEFECILVDDGSTDSSGKICDEYSMSDQRFIVLHTQNKGASHARNLGIDNSSGEYITFIDADDEVYKDYLKNLYECMISSGADIVIGSIKKIWDNQNEVRIVQYPKGNLVLEKEEVLQSFAKVQEDTGIFGYCTCKLFKREKIQDIRFDESLKLAEDFDFYLKLYNNIISFYFDDKPYYYYRQEAENSTVEVADQDVDYFSQLKINVRYRDFLKREKVYTGENKRIVEEKINNYVYFTMFYCPKENMKERFYALYEFCKESFVVYGGRSLLQKVLLKLLKYRHFGAAKKIIFVYRYLRSMRNDNKK